MTKALQWEGGQRKVACTDTEMGTRTIGGEKVGLVEKTLHTMIQTVYCIHKGLTDNSEIV